MKLLIQSLQHLAVMHTKKLADRLYAMPSAPSYAPSSSKIVCPLATEEFIMIDSVTPRPPWVLGPVLWVAAGRLSRRGSDRE
ncbi:hypothetical protein Taro_046170 [Colocasia esculenta]|uniref:Uncharacterized protein n=1 Tax=Colocasia esculenta TaxID=4460 RepID=A0A843WP38_COLES|nr:hypothetical protein [Colocasia esculenta]